MENIEDTKIGNWESMDKRLNTRSKPWINQFLLGKFLGGTVYLSAANLPEELQQMRDYFNNPSALTNVTYVVTNYITPAVFTSIADMQRAMRSAEFNFDQQTVDYYGYSYDPKLPGSILRSLPGDLFQNHKITRRIDWDRQSRLPRTISVIHNDNHAQLYQPE